MQMITRRDSIAILATPILLNGCRRSLDTWRTELSPDQQAEARIIRVWGYPAHAWMRFEVRTDRYQESIDPHSLFEHWRGDVDPGLGICEIAWSPDSTRVAFLAGVKYRAVHRMVSAAYDVKQRVLLDPATLANAMRQALRKRFREELESKPGIDPLDWAESNEAMDSYASRYGPK
jgi:hypothetical protein